MQDGNEKETEIPCIGHVPHEVKIPRPRCIPTCQQGDPSSPQNLGKTTSLAVPLHSSGLQGEKGAGDERTGEGLGHRGQPADRAHHRINRKSDPVEGRPDVRQWMEKIPENGYLDLRG